MRFLCWLGIHKHEHVRWRGGGTISTLDGEVLREDVYVEMGRCSWCASDWWRLQGDLTWRRMPDQAVEE